MNRKSIPIADEDSIPSIEFFKEAFKRFKECKLSDYNDVLRAYVDAFDSYPIAPLIVSEGNADFVAYRAISEEEIIAGNLDPCLVSTFCHPPSQIAKPQRFNILNKPVFYGSSKQHTCIEEKLVQSTIKIIYLSTWKFLQEIPYSYVSFYYRPHNTFLQEISEVYERKLNETFSRYSLEKREALKYYIEELTNLSLVEPFSPLTSALGNYYMSEFGNTLSPRLTYIEYPSTRKTIGANYAINPALIEDGTIVCAGVSKYSIINHSESLTGTNRLEIGIVNGSQLKWQPFHNFSYRIELATFYDEHGIPFKSVQQKDLKNNFLVASADKKISVTDFLMDKLDQQILSDGSSFTLRDQLPLVKRYDCNFDPTFGIDKFICKKIEVNVSFKTFD